MKKIAGLLKSYLVDGILLFLLGLVMLIWPNDTLNTVCILIGAAVGVMGIIKTVAYLMQKDKENRKLTSLIVGIIQIIAGILVMCNADFFVSFFQIISGIVILYGAVILFVQAFKSRQEKGAKFTAALIMGAINLFLAVVILINPAQFAAFMTQLNGVSLMIEGISMVVLFIGFRNNKQQTEND